LKARALALSARDGGTARRKRNTEQQAAVNAEPQERGKSHANICGNPRSSAGSQT
jgi:hypothetical protein